VSEATASTQAARPLSRAQTAQTALAVGVAALTAALTVAGLALALAAHEDNAEILGPLVLAFAVAPAGTGLAVVVRRPGNVIGWLLLAEGAFVALGILADEYALQALIAHPGSLPGGRWAALWSDASWPLLFGPIAAIAFLMPNGRYLDETWRRRARLSFWAFGVLFVTGFVQPKGFDPPFEDVESPLPRAPEALATLRLILVFIFLAALVTAALAIRARFRRAVGIERVQLLWFANAALFVPLALVVCLAGGVVGEEAGDAVFIAIALAGIAVPLSIGVAILRHGLFDIELVLSRTLVYGTLTALIVVVYFAVVIGLGSLVDSRSSAGLLAVGLVAVGIEPVRSRLQRRADRFVYGDRSTPQAALRRLSERLQGSLAPSAVLPSVVDSVAEALRLPYAAVEAGDEVAARHGEPGRGELVRLPMSYRGETVGRLVVEVPPGAELARADRALLSDLAAHAAVAVHAARLTTDLQRSRERLVAAREEERRRLRRDLHDGLGPDLAAIALRLDVARAMAGDAPVADVIGELRNETRSAIAQIRQIVDELRPPALDELGLVSAIGEHAARMATITVEVNGPDPEPQLPAAVEVAAYRIALEAITNAARHSEARNCQVCIAVNGALELDVSDDGAGLPRDLVPGVGLGSMRERAAELGGSCEVTTAPDGGTVVHARLPLERA
jgi:two-component system, NarL family, sensor kinase